MWSLGDKCCLMYDSLYESESTWNTQAISNDNNDMIETGFIFLCQPKMRLNLGGPAREGIMPWQQLTARVIRCQAGVEISNALPDRRPARSALYLAMYM